MRRASGVTQWEIRLVIRSLIRSLAILLSCCCEIYCLNRNSWSTQVDIPSFRSAFRWPGVYAPDLKHLVRLPWRCLSSHPFRWVSLRDNRELTTWLPHITLIFSNSGWGVQQCSEDWCRLNSASLGYTCSFMKPVSCWCICCTRGERDVMSTGNAPAKKYKQEETLISFDLKKELDVIIRLFTGCLLLIWASPK